ncbi:hypothetical protein [Geomesophilobacter sediminis]|uniref:Uncharacterized protein n=1 Tax=Geomesophilobacter sediminis TaxID=2798584 RepID=A0A8J7JFN7_9BACT|nr:hypothetical protein [Geomesophilobacter sediminis]MBJ6726381.1 hypothetical protein [Geomesophilobacter sediminis]
MRHPHYDYTLDEALALARSIKYGPLPLPSDPTPGIPEAIEIVGKSLRTCGFNWITGRVALELLRKANSEEVAWS